MMSENPIEKIGQIRRELFDQGPDFERENGDFHRVSLPSRDCDVLRDFVGQSGATRAIEIGLAYGASALAIAEGLASTSIEHEHVILDPFQDLFHDVGWRLISNAGLEQSTKLIRRRSQFALPELIVGGQTADIAFVDGSHLFHNVLLDLTYLEELVVFNGLIILDDVQHLSVAKAVAYFVANRGWTEVSMRSSETRLKAFRLPDGRVKSSFEDFVEF